MIRNFTLQMSSLIWLLLIFSTGALNASETHNHNINKDFNSFKFIDGKFEFEGLTSPQTIYISCPNNVHVSCLHYTGNPSDYGHPTVNNPFNIHYTIVEHPPVFNTNSCGIGQITRSWTITSQFGTFNCTQQINVSGAGSSFGAHHITWPLDYTITDGCHPDLDPDNIPPPFNKPTWSHVPCTMIGISYKDHVFFFDGPPYSGDSGCKKILRTWKVMDWCTHVPNTNIGIWTHVQVIKVMDSHPPFFTHCPQDVTVGTYDNNCNGAFVSLPRAIAADNCSNNVTVTNNSPFSYSNGGDASGFYPLGTTTVTFTANDGCQNFATCTVRITVRDLKKPTPICYHGLATTLMPMGDDGFVQLSGKVFDAGSYDNCTPQHLLQFSLSPNSFTCEDRGVQEVIMTVTDQSGNSDFCITYVRIQDNMGVCPPDTSGGLISGLIKFMGDGAIEGVSVYSKKDNDTPDVITDENGMYMLEDLYEGHDYQIQPSKHTNLRDGVSVADLVRLRRHIIGDQRLTDPYQIIAADFNMDGQVSLQDYLQLRMVLLLGIDEFPGMHSWRFIDRDYEFENPEYPLGEEFTEIYMIEDHTKTDMEVNFIGIKLGDINGSMLINSGDFDGLASRSTNSVDLKFEDRMLQRGEEVAIKLYTSDLTTLHGMQAAFKFDQFSLEFKGLGDETMEGVTDENIGLVRLDEGILSFVWDDVEGTSIDEETVIAELIFESQSNALLSDVWGDLDDFIEGVVLDGDLNEFSINLSPIGILGSTEDGIKFVSNSPNPFSSECVIEFTANSSELITCTINDINGRTLKHWEIAPVEGRNTIIVDGSWLPSAGVYTYTLTSQSGQVTRKLIYQ